MLLWHWQTAAPKLGELKAKMVDYAMQHASEVGEGLEVLPGVRDLLEFLSRQPDVVIGLVQLPTLFSSFTVLVSHSSSLSMALFSCVFLCIFSIEKAEFVLAGTGHCKIIQSLHCGTTGDRKLGGHCLAQNGRSWHTTILLSSQFRRVIITSTLDLLHVHCMLDYRYFFLLLEPSVLLSTLCIDLEVTTVTEES